EVHGAIQGPPRCHVDVRGGGGLRFSRRPRPPGAALDAALGSRMVLPPLLRTPPALAPLLPQQSPLPRPRLLPVNRPPEILFEIIRATAAVTPGFSQAGSPAQPIR